MELKNAYDDKIEIYHPLNYLLLTLIRLLFRFFSSSNYKDDLLQDSKMHPSIINTIIFKDYIFAYRALRIVKGFLGNHKFRHLPLIF